MFILVIVLFMLYETSLLQNAVFQWDYFALHTLYTTLTWLRKVSIEMILSFLLKIKFHLIDLKMKTFYYEVPAFCEVTVVHPRYQLCASNRPVFLTE